MALHVIVTAKQVIDPDMPLSAMRIGDDARQVVTPPTLPPVVNGFDEVAVEAALRLKDGHGAKVTVLSVGGQVNLDVIKKPLAMGADTLVLCQDAAFAELSDSFVTARVLAAAVRKIGAFDLLLCGRQASDWDNAQVPLLLAETLDVPCIPLAQKVDVEQDRVVVEQLVPDGYDVVEADLPALVTVSNELGAPRYPNMRHLMAAKRKRPVVWRCADLGLDAAALSARVEVLELRLPQRRQECEFIAAADGAAAGEKLAATLHEAGLI
jgi:electron transfer flavoprotein beta subunit